MTKEEYTEMMKYEFGMYDKDKSGTIEKKESTSSLEIITEQLQTSQEKDLFKTLFIKSNIIIVRS